MKTLYKSLTAVTAAALLSATLVTTVYAGSPADQPCAAHPSERCAALNIMCWPQPPKYMSWFCVQS
ncbi:MAG: hypothetical protein ACT4NU_03200 [Chromatiales bacterium]